jgi:hypothetical protein
MFTKTKISVVSVFSGVCKTWILRVILMLKKNGASKSSGDGEAFESYQK